MVLPSLINNFAEYLLIFNPIFMGKKLPRLPIVKKRGSYVGMGDTFIAIMPQCNGQLFMASHSFFLTP
ncbi:hypothetical protein EV677_1705 [Herminiimonas fonticola]|uniref:Uncharacterized protein n=1 Tax=Herminiimonas fonticola TaxID=303380 RepID=A0A4R6G7D1_9BURK|nr:hypothetical protein Hfont_2714 [Herminiimonas fonticola]TDN89645.1 hypothetical protein EV677_1705 [Herminiimonas fonticola]